MEKINQEIYKKNFILSAKKQKLAIEKLEKKTFKTYNIKALWQCNCKLGFNSKARIIVFDLAESSESALGKEKNSAYFLFDVI